MNSDTINSLINYLLSYMLILTSDELRELTDKSQPAAQIRWLKECNWVFAVGRNGLPKVARTYFERKMGQESLIESPSEIKAANWQVNIDALRHKPNLSNYGTQTKKFG